jgi:hypothetical protein
MDWKFIIALAILLTVVGWWVDRELRLSTWSGLKYAFSA